MGSLPKTKTVGTMSHTTLHDNYQTIGSNNATASTSNESLPYDEKYQIRHSARKDGRGVDNLPANSNHTSFVENYSNRSSIDVSSSYNTLIIHNGDESWIGKNLEGNAASILRNDTVLSTLPQSEEIVERSGFLQHNLQLTRPSEIGVQELTDIPDDYLNQSFVLKHLAKECISPLSNSEATLKAPVETYCYGANSETTSYANWRCTSPMRSATASIRQTTHDQNTQTSHRNISKSQPDLTTIAVADKPNAQSFKRGLSAPKTVPKAQQEVRSGGDAWSAVEMIEILIKENSTLKIELDECYKKVAKTQKLEHEIFKVHKAQEELIQSCDRRERLERVARNRYQSDNLRLQELNRALRGQIDLLSSQMSRTSLDLNMPDAIKRELNKRDVLINQLMAQNKELIAAKERQEIELAAQRATLQEQRTHIDILETALTNAQSNVVRLEEEIRKKQTYVERVAQLQRALSSLQLASERREQIERKLRIQLERELQRTKMGNGAGENNTNAAWNSSGDSEQNLSSHLSRKLREKDEHIMKLTGECSRWEQRYLEESAMRQAAIDAASIPKDAKIAALEKTSQETEKIIAEARNEKIRHMDEVHATQKKVADLESRTKELESKLAERDAMIKVLHKRTYDKDMSNVLNRSPHSSSLSGTDIGHVLATSVARDGRSSGFSTDSAYNENAGSYHVPSFTKYDSGQDFNNSTKTLDNQLNEFDSQLDSQLLTKRALCCFPGFINPMSIQRKSKLTKSLLGANNGSLYERNNFLLPTQRNRHKNGEMLLLEKQGRSSQQQRNSEGRESSEQAAAKSKLLSPSSLPRPPRLNHKSGLPRRLGDYNRLPEGIEIQRKKSDASSVSTGSNVNSQRASPAKSLIPSSSSSSHKLGQYGRLSDCVGSNVSLAKLTKVRFNNRPSERDSTSTMSENSINLLATNSNCLRFNRSNERNSFTECDRKCSTDSAAYKFRIQL